MQLSKLEVRILLVMVVVMVGILAVVIVPRLVAPAPAEPATVARVTATPTSSPIALPTPSPTPTQKSEQRRLDDIVASTVSVYSVLVCNNLQEFSALSIPQIVDRVLTQYPTTGLSDQSRQVMAHRVLAESAAKSCPDQSPRVAAGITQG
jgi:hypothetical protein